MQPEQNQYVVNGQTYTISSSTLLATSYIPLGIVIRRTEEPNEEPEAHSFLYKSMDGEYLLVNDGEPFPMQILPLQGAKYWFNKLPFKKVTVERAFGESEATE